MAGQQVVKVYIYDLSKGMARTMSAALLGKQIDGVWHTGIVVYGQEFYYGGMGVQSCTPGQLPILGQPDQIVDVGKTEIPYELFVEHLKDLVTTTFRASCYHILEHNCNTFSDEVAQFLTGNPIPSHITSLPQDVMNTPLGAMLKPMIDAMQVSPGGRPMFEEPTGMSGASAATQHSTARQPGQTSHGCVENEYFPKTTFISFDTANIPAILCKLRDFNREVDGAVAVKDEDIDALQGLIDGTSYHSTRLNTLQTLLKWPADKLFPVLDVLRLAIRNAEVNQYFCAKKQSASFLQLLVDQVCQYQLPANQMLALRTLCNTFSHILGKTLLTASRDDILSLLPNCVTKANKNVQIAASSVLLNFAVRFHLNDDKESIQRCTETCDKMCGSVTDPEACFRMLVCTGTLLSHKVEKCPSNLAGFVQQCSSISESQKVADCAKYVAQLV